MKTRQTPKLPQKSLNQVLSHLQIATPMEQPIESDSDPNPALPHETMVTTESSFPEILKRLAPPIIPPTPQIQRKLRVPLVRRLHIPHPVPAALIKFVPLEPNPSTAGQRKKGNGLAEEEDNGSNLDQKTDSS